jgi:dihydrofolate reductase
MGRKTWESLPVKPLPDRLNIIISKSWCSNGLNPASWMNCVASSFSSALYFARTTESKEAYIIGGAGIYEEAIPLADTLLLTRVDQNTTIEYGDEVAYFPVETWKRERVNFELEQVEYRDGYRFERWERKK